MIPARCPRCSSRDSMRLVVSGRYEACMACPGGIGMWTYVAVAGAPRHWMDGRSVRLPVQVTTTIEEKPTAKRAVAKRRPTTPRGRARR